MSLPSPTFTFTIPSVHDDTILNCRLYLSQKHSTLQNEQVPKGAIIAHPYAPLGGCYDDPVVQSVGKVLLTAGYVVVTFNFR
jgi:alpha/beta superfamily hydrolase